MINTKETKDALKNFVKTAARRLCETNHDEMSEEEFLKVFVNDTYTLNALSIEPYRQGNCKNYKVSAQEGKYFLKIYPETVNAEYMRTVDKIRSSVNEELMLPLRNADGKTYSFINNRIAELYNFIKERKKSNRQEATERMKEAVKKIVEFHTKIRSSGIEDNKLECFNVIMRRTKGELKEHGDFFSRFIDTKKICAKIDLLIMSGEKHQIIHGDMQANNILLSRNQANIVDFERMKYGPATYDMAAFITSITYKDKDHIDFNNFSGCVKQYYSETDGSIYIRHLTDMIIARLAELTVSKYIHNRHESLKNILERLRLFMFYEDKLNELIALNTK